MTVLELGERAVLARIQAHVRTAGRQTASLVIGIGDDAAVYAPARNAQTVLTTDALVEAVHFDRRFSAPGDIGYRALAVNLSDLAAMGAVPRWALLSLVLPDDLLVADLEALVEGLVACGTAFGCEVIGGNVARSPGPLVVDVTAVGEVRPRRVLTRAGGRPGDELWVSGEIGAAVAGLELLLSKAAKVTEAAEEEAKGAKGAKGAAGQEREAHQRDAEQRDAEQRDAEQRDAEQRDAEQRDAEQRDAEQRDAEQRDAEQRDAEQRDAEARRAAGRGAERQVAERVDAGGAAAAGRDDDWVRCLDRYLRPEPRVRLGLAVSRARAARAAIDLSDGLAEAAHQLAEASGCGVEIDAAALPINPAARAWWEAAGEDVVLRAMRGGDDYELLIAVPRAWGGRLRHARSRVAAPALTRIGVLTKDRHARVLRREGAREPLPGGFEHW